nr:MAG TPA: hypothetical protein [Caudoviricetes sp.]
MFDKKRHSCILRVFAYKYISKVKASQKEIQDA